MPAPHPLAGPRARLLERAHRHCAAKSWETAYQELVRADEEQPLGLEDLRRLSYRAALTARDPQF